MQIKIFVIPINDSSVFENEVEELNKFLRSNKIIEIRKDIVSLTQNAYWTFCITYFPNTHFDSPESRKSGLVRPKIDYKAILDSEAFDRFCILRKIRKTIADNDAVPAYAVYTDAELAELSKFEFDSLSKSKIQSIPGIGEKKTEKYGSKMLDMLSKLMASNSIKGEEVR